MRLPHAISIFGTTYRIRWGSTKDKEWIKDRLAGEQGGWEKTDATIVSRGDRHVITIHPRLRRDPVRAWAALFHEILHIIQWELERIGGPRGKTRTHAGVHLPHAIIERLDGLLGQFAVDTGLVIPCVCEPCKRKAAVAKPIA